MLKNNLLFTANKVQGIVLLLSIVIIKFSKGNDNEDSFEPKGQNRTVQF